MVCYGKSETIIFLESKRIYSLVYSHQYVYFVLLFQIDANSVALNCHT